VFTQYNQDEKGKRTPLPKPNIDTGMGLERTAAAMQGKTSVYETDLFLPLINHISELAGKQYGTDSEADNAIRIVAEHGRGITFLIADGVLPSNEGRGYVLRRLLRRAQYFSQALASDTPFVVEVAKTVIDNMGGTYPELVASRDNALKIIESEIESFQGTLLVGSARLTRILIAFREELVDYFPKFEKSFKQVLSEHDIIELSSKIGVAVDHFLRDCGAWEHYLRVAGRDAVGETLKPIEDGLVALKKAASHYDGTQPNAFVDLKRHLWSLFEGVEKSVKEVAAKLSGYEVFILYDTYGLPVETTKDIAAEHGLSIDLEGFEKEMEKQQERARVAQKLGSGKVEAGPIKLTLPPRTFDFTLPKLQFVGYDNLIYKTVIVGLSNYEPTDKESEPTLCEGQEAGVILEATPFYGEMGGQVGDTGEIVSSKAKFSVTSTIRGPQDVVIHQGKVAEGSLSVGDEVEAIVNKERRWDIARNHTATHLLQMALRQVLGEHVQQRGSLVAPDRLRFDFSHLEALTKEEIEEVNRIVNDKIRQNLKVKDQKMPYRKAIEEGAIALFDEKYGDEVRVVRIGEEVISAELCGGTHVNATGEIGFFWVISEGSIGAGLRRIEAVSGRGAEEFVSAQSAGLHNVAKSLKAPPTEVQSRVSDLVTELERERRRALDLERELSRRLTSSLVSQVETVSGVKVLAARVPPYRLEALREISDQLRDQLGSVVIVLGTIYENKPLFLTAVTPDLVTKGYHAGEIVNRVAEVAGGRGGGRAQFAQAGGRYKNKLDEALKRVKDFIQGGG
jgi:alanyl-tRNA synthetase